MWLQTFCKAVRLGVWTMNLINKQKMNSMESKKHFWCYPNTEKGQPLVHEDTFPVTTEPLYCCPVTAPVTSSPVACTGVPQAPAESRVPLNSQPPYSAPVSWKAKNYQALSANIAAPPGEGDEAWNSKPNRAGRFPRLLIWPSGGLAQGAECDANVDVALNEATISSQNRRRLV